MLNDRTVTNESTKTPCPMFSIGTHHQEVHILGETSVHRIKITEPTIAPALRSFSDVPKPPVSTGSGAVGKVTN